MLKTAQVTCGLSKKSMQT